MRAFKGSFVLGLLTLVTASAPVSAAWNNVFQVTCCRNAPAVVEARSPCCPDPCPPPCPPQPVCTTRYVQRCYYQPVTTYKRQISYSPVTTYQRSYYWEPVTAYRYSCYYDPCTCRYQRVATPVTSYRLRSRCNAVTSYVQRCQMVPVTQYRQISYYEPVTSCSYPPAVSDSGSSAPPPKVTEEPAPNRPSVGEQRIPPIQDNKSYRMPNADGSSLRLPPVKKPAPPRRPRVQLDRIVSLPGHNVEGRVASANGNNELLFVSADVQGAKESATTDGQGRFRLTLGAGRWLVYVNDASGRPVYQKQIDVGAEPVSPMRLVSR